MKRKTVADHRVVATPTCGELREILGSGDCEKLDLAVAINLRPTKAHFHSTFEEIYLVLDGSMTLVTYEPGAGKIEEQQLSANELCIIPQGTHHRISTASENNRLCVISVPHWRADDEELSDKL